MIFDLQQAGGLSVTPTELQTFLSDPQSTQDVFSELASLNPVEWSEVAELECATEAVYQILRKIFRQASKEQARLLKDALASVDSIDWSLINQEPNALAILYNFLPFADTGSVVAGKRLRQAGDVFDVFSLDLSGRNSIDPTTLRIGAPYIAHHELSTVGVRWANRLSMMDFALQACKYAERRISQGQQYEYVYSRAMWIDSHLAASYVKSRNPDLKWVAEFSDPLSLNVEGEPRKGNAADGWLFDDLLTPIVNKYEVQRSMTVFQASELLAFANADKIIFTNEHQKQTMLASIDDITLKERVERVSFVSNHPTLPRKYYSLGEAKFSKNLNSLNLGYFGAFYSNRGITEVIDAIDLLPPDDRARINLVVYTNSELGDKHLDRSYLTISNSLNYLDFLATADQFDYLIVNDVASGSNHVRNPYLPSKYSDYAGSKSKIWAIAESGSSLANKPAHVLTARGDVGAAKSALNTMLGEKFGSFRGNSPASMEGTSNQQNQHAIEEPTDDTDLKPLALNWLEPRSIHGSQATDEAEELLDLEKQVRELRQRSSFYLSQMSNSIYPKSKTVISLTSSGHSAKVDKQLPVRQVSVADPFWPEEYESFRAESLEFPGLYGLSVGISQLAHDIASKARESCAAAIESELSPVVSFAGLIAARRLGIPYICHVNRDDTARHAFSTLAERIRDPLSSLMNRCLREAEIVTASTPEIAGALAKANLEPQDLITFDDFEKIQSTPIDRPSIYYFGSRYRSNFEEVADVLTSYDETTHEVDCVVVDFTGGNLPEDLDKILWKCGGAGIPRVFLVEKDFHCAKFADVLIWTASGYAQRRKGADFSHIRANIQLPGMSLNQLHEIDVTETPNAFDQFALQIVSGVADATPPVRYGTVWDSITRFSPSFQQAESVEDQELLEGIQNLVSGRSGADFAIHALRAAGVSVEHPRATAGARLRDSFSRDLSKQTIRPVREAVEYVVEAARRFDLNASLKVEDNVLQGVVYGRQFRLDLSPPQRRINIDTSFGSSQGVSLVLPTYKGRDRILGMLNSISRQTLQKFLIEVIVVCNGPNDGTAEIVGQWARENPAIATIIVHSEPGVANARNLGIKTATKDYLTFIDDDDQLCDNYLLSMYARHDPNVVVLGRLSDIDDETGAINTKTSQNGYVASLGRDLVDLGTRWHVLGLNAAKLLPSTFAKKISYDPTLKSAEDQLYMLELLSFPLELTSPRPMENSDYMRVRRHGSISRRDDSFQFSVVEQIQVMSKFRELKDKYGHISSIQRGTEGMTLWHANVIMRFARNNPQLRSEIANALRTAGFDNHPVLVNI